MEKAITKRTLVKIQAKLIKELYAIEVPNVPKPLNDKQKVWYGSSIKFWIKEGQIDLISMIFEGRFNDLKEEK